MLIECPFCHAQARIPPSKEGAKVRCGACAKLYVARDPRARRRTSSTQGLSIAIFLGAAVVAALVFYALNRMKSAPLPVTAAVEPAPVPAPRVDRRGWDAEPVLAARALCEAAFARNEPRLRQLLAPVESADDRLARLLGAPQAGELPAGDEEPLAAWKPFDGEVLAEAGGRAAVRVSLAGRGPETAAETRQLDLDLVLLGGEWKVLDWARYRTPEQEDQQAQSELRAQRAAAEERIETRTLPDGSLVFEAEPGPIPYPESTSAALRAGIQARCERMLDFRLRPTENAAAKAELVAIGAPALPALLTAMHALPLETHEDAMRVNLVNQCLEEITGVHTGFKPQVQEGSGVGTTAERRESAIRQWFAWWYREGVRFEGRPDPAPAEGSSRPSGRDRSRLPDDERTNGGGSR